MNGSGHTRNSKRVADVVRQEVIDVLLDSEDIIEFNSIFLRVSENMKKKGFSTGGEEILRLRIYEKLQTLVSEGGVKKRGKEYEPLDKLSEIKLNAESSGNPRIL